MAKAKSKETSLPLIFALVFFVLTTIAFGVMWYLSYSEVEQAKADKKKAEGDLKAPRDAERESNLKARVYRLYLGWEEGDDKSTIEAEKGSATVSNEVQKINEAVAKKLGVATAADLPDEFKFWVLDENRRAKSPPAEALLDLYAKIRGKETVYKAADDERDAYKKQIDGMKAAITALAAVQAKYQTQIDTLPGEFKADLKKVTDGYKVRTDQYTAAEARANDKITEITADRDKFETLSRALKKQLDALASDNDALRSRINAESKEKVTYDEPQGKILRKLPEGVVEINLGSAAGVRPGLTFTVLPPDFPQKGRQSRMRMLRTQNAKGEFTSVEMFVPKGSIEVYEVVSPTLSLARIQPGSELDPIRDGIAVGDLIYNSVWRKGVADHIALIGIFDVNGDGIDDIESVVKDLRNMGIPVDAYFDMRKREWVGEVTDNTRYVVEGFKPLLSGTDPNRDEKSKLLEIINNKVKDARARGVDRMNFRDFFSRMGYKFRLDVPDDKVNQATAPYLSNVGVGNPVPMPPAPQP
ncbi:MAG: hypothetical protein FJ304_05195 [Planctomycetes bacterium]|nr:hypothetical protein [Planctomycetota bacterium]